MANIQYYDVILKPVITEKSMGLMADKKYTFLVHPEANKTQIKEAVEKMFAGTKVKSVNTMNQDGKTKRRGMTYGKKAGDQKYRLKKNSGVMYIKIHDMSFLAETYMSDTEISSIDLLGIPNANMPVYEWEV